MKPTVYGPVNPPSFATEVMRAIPEAAAKPVRNSLGNAKKTGKCLGSA